MTRLDRNERERICLIFNPRSAGGATGRRINELKDAVARHFTRFEFRPTRHAGHATELAAAAAAEGFDIVASVGGDGTAHEVVNGLVGPEGERSKCVFTVVPAGTGGDLARTLRIPREPDGALVVAAHGEDRASDVMRIECANPDSGENATRYAINSAGFGMNGDIVDRVNKSSKRLGPISFLGATVSVLADYAPPEVEIAWEEGGEERSWTGRLFGAFATNGQYCGGGMWLGRGKTMQDGKIELTIVPRLPARHVASALPRLYNGRLDEVPGVVCASTAAISMRAPDGSRVRIEADGEQPGVLPGRVGVLPKALMIRGKW